ncbi:MAG: sialate O-acetylesterase [Phycisphaera sp.]|nr:sialate O-acetylesterase [Phycisphaera sp.]
MERSSHRMVVLFNAIVVAVAYATCASAVEPARIFDSHMVLQRDAPIPVWGTAEPGELVTVTFAAQRVSAKADAKGQWSLELKPLSASAAPREMTITGDKSDKGATYNDVLVGEVWFCSGQSNMVLTVDHASDAAREIAAANWPQIRHAAGQYGGWRAITPDSVAKISAVAYAFGRELHEKLGVPIGLIQSAVGGTKIEAWTSPRGMARCEVGRAYLEERRKTVEDVDSPEAKKAYEASVERWRRLVERFEKKGLKPPPKPEPPIAPKEGAMLSGVLFANKVRPSVPYAIRGVIWYQGESNAAHAQDYVQLLPAMIADWRDAWGKPDMPFLIVQLPNFRAHDTEPTDSPWSTIREAQSQAATGDAHTEVAVTIDVGEAENLHPLNKREVGRRLSLIARARVYGEDIQYAGPVFKSAKFDNGRAIVEFDRVFDGLRTTDGVAIKGFALAGEDHVFHWADASISESRVVVTSDKVAVPVAVRYAWGNNPDCNLTSSSNLPAEPFRTDDWPPSDPRQNAAKRKKTGDN